MCICLCRGEAAVVRTPVGATKGHKQTKTGKRERGEEGGWKEREKEGGEDRRKRALSLNVEILIQD